MLKRKTTVDNFTARERFLESTEGVLQQILQGVSDKRAGDCKRPQKWREIVNNHWKYRKKGKNKAPWRSASVHLHTGPPAMYQYFLARTTWAPSAPFCVAVTERYWSPTTTLKAKRRSKMRGWNPIIFSCLSFFSSSRFLNRRRNFVYLVSKLFQLSFEILRLGIVHGSIGKYQGSSRLHCLLNPIIEWLSALASPACPGHLHEHLRKEKAAKLELESHHQMLTYIQAKHSKTSQVLSKNKNNGSSSAFSCFSTCSRSKRSPLEAAESCLSLLSRIFSSSISSFSSRWFFFCFSLCASCRIAWKKMIKRSKSNKFLCGV